MAKLSVAGICREYLDTHAGSQFSADELHKVCKQAGLDVTPAQVYGGLQVMASTGKAVRGSEARTYRSVGTVITIPAPTKLADIVERPVKQPVEKKPRAKKQMGHSDESVVARMTELHGEPVSTKCPVTSLIFILNGTEDGDYISKRYSQRIHKEVTSWYVYEADGATVVALPI